MTCYLALSRRLELVVARAAGVSAWQFIAPALASSVVLGVLATTAYNPMSANLRERSKQMEAELLGSAPGGGVQDASGFWINQVNSDGQVIINAARSEQQGVRLTGLTLFRFDTNNQFKERIEAREATLEDGRWAFKSLRRYSLDSPPVDQDSWYLPTSLTPAQVRNSFSTPETVSFWQLPSYIRSSESSGFATAGYRLQYHKLIAQPFLLAAMVMLAAAVSLRFFRFGGVQKMVLSGVGAGLRRGCPCAWAASPDFWPCCTRRTGSGRCRRPPEEVARVRAAHDGAPLSRLLDRRWRLRSCRGFGAGPCRRARRRRNDAGRSPGLHLQSGSAPAEAAARSQ
jgi:lipopolysaccharide export system permease protein